MIAHLPSRHPLKGPVVEEWPDVLSWATPYHPGEAISTDEYPRAGDYLLTGLDRGHANVTLGYSNNGTRLESVTVQYSNYSDDGLHYLNGWETVTMTKPVGPWLNVLDWKSDIHQTGITNGTKKTSPDGFHLEINVRTNIFNATGNLTTTLDGVVHLQPANET